jgi:hypothetical protein
MSSKFLILTANVGDRDNLVDPLVKYPNCDYLAITDNINECKIWNQVHPLSFSNIDNYNHRRNAKIYKVLSSILYPDYEYIIWSDANHQLNEDPENILKEYGDFDLLLFKHPHRDCCFDEMNIVKQHLDDPYLVQTQYNHYLNKGMPRNFGLTEMTCFIKKNNDKIKKLDMMWWEQICKFSSRDQCSFTYCVWSMRNDNLIIKKFKGHANIYAGGNSYFIEQEGHKN